MNPPHYSTTVAIPDQLDDDLLAQMAALYLRHYDGSSEALFRHDLGQKDEVVLLFADGLLAGFTALKSFVFEGLGTPVRIVYSGDTIVERAHWGQQQLAFTCISRFGKIWQRSPDLPFYWLLLVKGHRTFRYLPAFTHSFYPHWQQDRSDLKPLTDALASALFGREYQPASGVVEFAESRGHLKAEIAYPKANESAKPETRFFLQRNPGYLRGHELVCLCELKPDNLKPLAARIFQQGLAEKAKHAT